MASSTILHFKDEIISVLGKLFQETDKERTLQFVLWGQQTLIPKSSKNIIIKEK